MKEIVKTNLKQRLDNIFIKIRIEAKQTWVDTQYYVHKLRYLSGKEVLKDYPELKSDKLPVGGRGISGGFRLAAKETGRDQVTIKKWVELTKKIIKNHNDSFKKWWEVEKIKLEEKYLNPSIKKIKPIIDTSKIELPEGKYFVICADPPWKYDFSATDSRAIESHYPTLTIEKIIEYKDKNNRKLIDLFNEDSVLFLWATAPKLREALQVLKGWSYEYITNAVWDKKIIGMGYWFRGQHEHLLIGVKGKISPPEVEVRVSSIFREQRESKHSKKPEKAYEIIEQMFPVNVNKPVHLDIFPGDERKGWISFGDRI